MKIEEEVISITTPLKYSITASRFSSAKDLKKTVVISSATGVQRKYYSNFASFFALKGIVVYTFDYKGIGESGSSIKVLKKTKTNLTNWGRNDQAAIVAFAKKEYPNSELILITHSVGGQLLGFNPKYHQLHKVVMVASQNGHCRFFNGVHQPKMWLLWYIIIPVLKPIFGYFPAKRLRLFENLPKNMVYEWAKWGRQKKCMMHFHNDTYFFEKIKIPIFCLSSANDLFAPKETVDWMFGQYKNAQLNRVHYRANDKQDPGHFGFFKSNFQQQFWIPTLSWILNPATS